MGAIDRDSPGLERPLLSKRRRALLSKEPEQLSGPYKPVSARKGHKGEKGDGSRKDVRGH